MKVQLLEDARDICRIPYRQLWSRSLTRTVLSNVGAHLMQWGANEICGSTPLVRRCCKSVNEEYQKALWGALSDEKTSKQNGCHFHTYGQIGIFFLDTTSNREERQDNPLLGAEQWQELQDALDQDLKVFVLCSPLFLLDWTPQRELAVLLQKLFEWKANLNPFREVLVLCGGTSVGLTSDVRDEKLEQSIPVIAASPLSGQISDLEYEATTVAERFHFVQRHLHGQHCFCVVDINLETRSLRPAVDVQLVGMPNSTK